MKRSPAFTLSELLIALAILGIIAIFTIPKVLQSQRDGRNKAITKEMIAAVSGAYQAYKLNNVPSATMHLGDLTPYLNYVKLQTTGSFDKWHNWTGTLSCSSQAPCIVFASGGLINYYQGNGAATSGNYFGQTQNNNYIYFSMDPDGTVTSQNDPVGPAKTVDGALYYNSKIILNIECVAGDVTYEDGTPQNWCPGSPAEYPPWFSWN